MAGIIGILFFWFTDPRSGLGGWLSGGAIDAANQAWAGTIVGMVGSTLMLLLGAWLVSRKMV